MTKLVNNWMGKILAEFLEWIIEKKYVDYIPVKERIAIVEEFLNREI